MVKIRLQMSDDRWRNAFLLWSVIQLCIVVLAVVIGVAGDGAFWLGYLFGALSCLALWIGGAENRPPTSTRG